MIRRLCIVALCTLVGCSSPCDGQGDACIVVDIEHAPRNGVDQVVLQIVSSSYNGNAKTPALPSFTATPVELAAVLPTGTTGMFHIDVEGLIAGESQGTAGIDFALPADRGRTFSVSLEDHGDMGSIDQSTPGPVLIPGSWKGYGGNWVDPSGSFLMLVSTDASQQLSVFGYHGNKVTDVAQHPVLSPNGYEMVTPNGDVLYALASPVDGGVDLGSDSPRDYYHYWTSRKVNTIVESARVESDAQYLGCYPWFDSSYSILIDCTGYAGTPGSPTAGVVALSTSSSPFLSRFGVTTVGPPPSSTLSLLPATGVYFFARITTPMADGGAQPQWDLWRADPGAQPAQLCSQDPTCVVLASSAHYLIVQRGTSAVRIPATVTTNAQLTSAQNGVVAIPTNVSSFLGPARDSEDLWLGFGFQGSQMLLWVVDFAAQTIQPVMMPPGAGFTGSFDSKQLIVSKIDALGFTYWTLDSRNPTSPKMICSSCVVPLESVSSDGSLIAIDEPSADKATWTATVYGPGLTTRATTPTGTIYAWAIDSDRLVLVMFDGTLNLYSIAAGQITGTIATGVTQSAWRPTSHRLFFINASGASILQF